MYYNIVYLSRFVYFYYIFIHIFISMYYCYHCHYLSIKTATLYILQLCSALLCMYKHKVIHRDLKASNIILDGYGVLIVSDFGSAKLFQLKSESDSDTTVNARNLHHLMSFHDFSRLFNVFKLFKIHFHAL